MDSQDNIELQSLLSERIGIDIIKSVCLSMQTPEQVDSLVALIHSDDARTAANAAWILTHLSTPQRQMLLNHHDELIDKVLTTPHTSLRRLLLAIIEEQPFSQESLRAEFIDFCLEHMLSLSEPPGVQSLCMKLAYTQCSFYPELLAEFKRSLEIMEMSAYAKSIRCIRHRIMTKKYKGERQ